MARFAQILTFAGDSPIVFSVSASTASAAKFTGQHRIMVINADQDITIDFGGSGVADPGTSNYRIPAGQQTTFDTGANSYFKVYNLDGSSSANVYVQLLEGR